MMIVATYKAAGGYIGTVYTWSYHFPPANPTSHPHYRYRNIGPGPVNSVPAQL